MKNHGPAQALDCPENLEIGVPQRLLCACCTPRASLEVLPVTAGVARHHKEMPGVTPVARARTRERCPWVPQPTAFRQSVAGATCIPANRRVNLNPLPSFLSWWDEDGACVGVQNAGTKLRVPSRNLQMIQGLGVKLCSPPGNVSGKLRIAICVPEQRERYKLRRIKAGFSPECLCNIRQKTNQQTKNLKPQPDFFFS